MGFLLLLVCIAVIAMWVVMFATLMLLTDAQLPGRYDKPLWVAAFLLAAPLAPFAFWVFKSGYEIELETAHIRSRERDAAEISV